MKIFYSFFFLFAYTSYGQVPEPFMGSLKVYGGNAGDAIGTYITKTQDGGFIVAIGSNSTYGTGNIDSFCSFGGERDVYLKYNSDGSILEWHKCFTTGGYIFPVNSSDFIYCTIINPSTGWAFAIGRENSGGTVLWQKTYGNNASAILRSMMACNDGGYIMLGETNYTDTDVLVHHGSSAKTDLWVLKIDSSGNKIWSTVLGGSEDESAYTVVAAPGGGCYVAGTTQSSDFDCTGYHAGGGDGYVARLDSNGHLLWHRDIGGSGDDGYFGYATENGKGGVIIALGSNSNDGDVHHHIGDYDYLVLEIDSSNNILWDNCYGSASSFEFPTAICKATDGSIWVTGESSVGQGEVSAGYGNGDAWLVHADSSGNFLSARVLGSSGADEGTMVYPLSNGFVLTGGAFSKNDGIFSDINWYGDHDAFLSVFAPWTTGISQGYAISANDIAMYPNPANEHVQIEVKQKGNYCIMITDVIGRTIYKATLTERIGIDVSRWQPGIYYVQVADNTGYKEVSKLIVQGI